MSAPRLLGVVGSAEGGTTHALVSEVLAGAEAEGAATDCLCLGRGPYSPGEARWREPFDALVLGTPMYRATFAGVLKAFLDDLPRGRPADGFASPLRAKPVAVVGTGASDHHYLGIDPLTALLTRFFAAYVVPPAVYGRADQVVDGAVADADLRTAARALGAATAGLAAAVAGDARLAGQRPQV